MDTHNPDSSQIPPMPPLTPVQPSTIPVPATPLTGDKSPAKNYRSLHGLFLILFVIAATVSGTLAVLLIGLLTFSYSGGSDPTSVNGLAFPIAFFIYIVIGLPLGLVTALLYAGYNKTKPRDN